MNWLGKVFVVLIFIMSLMFMTLSMAVYATHKNWKTVADGLNTQLQAAEAEKASLTTAHNRRVEELAAEKDAALQQVSKLASEEQSLSDRNVQIQAELDGLRQKEREQVAAVASTQALNQSLTTEVNDLRGRVRTEQQARDTAFAATLEATENAHQMRNELDTAVETNRQLLKDVAGKTHVLRERGINPATEPGSVVPTVNGLVSQVRRSGGAQFVEVTIGADDGLSEGNTLEVSRGSRYLGRIEIVETAPDKSVGRVDRRFQQGQIQEGDRVATRIQL
jgi:predicted  nucleic acid-binding Zn-ribbon protein